MPDTPELQARFGQSRKAKPGCGFPVAHLMVVFHAATGLLLQAFAAPLHSHDMGLVRRVHPQFKRGDVVAADRGFCSFAHLALLLARGVHAIFRLHQKQIVDFTPGRAHVPPTQKRAPKGMPRSRWLYALGTLDQVVEYLKPQTRPDWMTNRLGPITKSEPISIVKPEPPVAAGQGSGCPAHTTKPLGTQGSARSDVESGMWRGGVSPLGSGARTIPVKAVVVGRATAESPGAGCGAGRDRMTSVLSRGLSVSRWRRWIRAWGRDEPATDEPAA